MMRCATEKGDRERTHVVPVTFEPIVEGREGWGSMQLSGRRAFVAEGSASAPDTVEGAQGGQRAGGHLVARRLWEKKTFHVGRSE